MPIREGSNQQCILHLAFLLGECTSGCHGGDCELNGFIWGVFCGKCFAARVEDRRALKEKQGSRRTSWLPLISISGTCFLPSGNAARARTSPAGAGRPPRSMIRHRDLVRWTIQMVQVTHCCSLLFESGHTFTRTTLLLAPVW